MPGIRVDTGRVRIQARMLPCSSFTMPPIWRRAPADFGKSYRVSIFCRSPSPASVNPAWFSERWAIRRQCAPLPSKRRLGVGVRSRRQGALFDADSAIRTAPGPPVPSCAGRSRLLQVSSVDTVAPAASLGRKSASTSASRTSCPGLTWASVSSRRATQKCAPPVPGVSWPTAYSGANSVMLLAPLPARASRTRRTRSMLWISYEAACAESAASG